MNPTRRSTITFILLTILALAIAGCNIVGPIAYLVEGPSSQDALYTLPQKTTVVFLDDRGSVLPRARLRRNLTMRATRELLQVKRVIPGAITPEAAYQVAASETPNEPMAIDEIGRRVGAEVIIYASLKEFTLVSDSLPRPTCVMGVKVIDAQTGTRLWPLDQAEHRLIVQLAIKGGMEFDQRRLEEIYQQLADFSGLRLAQLFFTHEPNPLDAELNP